MKKSLKAFSLIEIMVATLLLGIMGSILYSSINASINAKDNIEKISLRYQLVRQAMSRMAREISMAYLSKHINKNEPVFITQFRGYHNKIFFSAFGNTVRQRDQKQSDAQTLGFFLGTDKEGRTSLMRRYHANLGLDVEKGPSLTQVLLPDVVLLEFFYFDDRYNKWEEEWFSDPSALAQSSPFADAQKADKMAEDQKAWRLPTMIKIVITAKMPTEEKKWVTATEIVVQKPLDLN